MITGSLPPWFSRIYLHPASLNGTELRCSERISLAFEDEDENLTEIKTKAHTIHVLSDWGLFISGSQSFITLILVL